jgi:DNA-binding response OmpR family regulator
MIQLGDAMKLLIVDTDRHQVEMLTSWLRTQGYEVCRAYTGEQARHEWRQQQPDLVIIDPTLEDMDGLALCSEMRVKHDALVLVIMDGRDVRDEVNCLDAGADDYLQKPFFPAQFLAHLRAVSRRGRSTLIQRPPAVITIGGMSIDSLHNEATINNTVVRLTPTESKLLHLLAVNVNNVCTAGQIVSHIWGFGNDGDAGLIKAHIRHLRQKIELDPSHPAYILTVPGVGYTLVRHHENDEQYSAEILLHSLRVSSL